ncbi:unnamed protein product [Sphenostylis stenocarpa]|uniref:rRNA adenine N(6)-methyltransferase n=1 Tax=Sphenostylis stenocarpa TaxID=92480 RepID=A0AA86SA48_9FABA|nr:unnamed protein product [Sphenostylis stenocarpa]
MLGASRRVVGFIPRRLLSVRQVHGDGDVEELLRFHKSRGQHILVNPRILDTIVRKSSIKPIDTILEIGPDTGTGNLTLRLLEAAHKVVAFEIDHRMVQVLEKCVLQRGFIKSSMGFNQKQSEAVNKFCRAVILIVVYATPIGGISTLMGTGVNLIIIGMWKSLFPDAKPISFNTWFFYGFPVAILILICFLVPNRVGLCLVIWIVHALDEKARAYYNLEGLWTPGTIQNAPNGDL